VCCADWKKRMPDTIDKRPNLATFKAAMEKLGCKKDKVYRLIREGRLAASRDCARTTIDSDTVAAYRRSLPKIELRG
jgi:excisionase family DNA binding protein